MRFRRLFERFTEKAIKVMTQAQVGAKELNHSKLCPEHILLGIVNQKSGIASKFLKAAGLTNQNIKEQLKISLKSIETSTPPDILPFSDSLKEVLRKTWDRSTEYNTHYIVPEHLFLSLIDEDSSKTLKLLELFDVDVERIISAVERIIEKKNISKTHPEFRHAKQLKQHYCSVPSVFEETSSLNLMNNALEKLSQSGFEALGTEQIMLALFEQSSESLLNIFEKAGISKEGFVQKLSEVNNRHDEYDSQHLLTPKAFAVINTAYETAKELGASAILPEHILLGILKEKGGIAYKILKESGVDTKHLYGEILSPIEKQKPATMTVLKIAKEEARRLGHNVLGSELILLGIIGEGDGIGSKVLVELGINIKDARKAVEDIIGFGDEYQGKDIVLSSRVKRILESAWSEAKKMNKPSIESEHLLLGIINEKDCVANKVLENLGVDALEIKQGILNRIGNP